jgi:hypothetical protein
MERTYLYYGLTAILLQELVENSLIDLNELADKYTMNEEQKTALKEIYNIYFEE